MAVVFNLRAMTHTKCSFAKNQNQVKLGPFERKTSLETKFKTWVSFHSEDLQNVGTQVKEAGI